MIYDNSNVRRQDRLLTAERAIEILTSGEYGFLAMVSADAGYGIPISYVFESDHIYFHCAPEGEKLRAIEQNNRVSFCVVGRTGVVSHQFTTAYESVIAKGTIVTQLTDTEKMHALELILDKYSPEDKEMGMKYAAKSFARTAILKLEIATLSGKAKAVKMG